MSFHDEPFDVYNMLMDLKYYNSEDKSFTVQLLFIFMMSPSTFMDRKRENSEDM